MPFGIPSLSKLLAKQNRKPAETGAESLLDYKNFSELREKTDLSISLLQDPGTDNKIPVSLTWYSPLVKGNDGIHKMYDARMAVTFYSTQKQAAVTFYGEACAKLRELSEKTEDKDAIRNEMERFFADRQEEFDKNPFA